jgi:TRAP-type C4-dicarboxylate transport system permease small subunit
MEQSQAGAGGAPNYPERPGSPIGHTLDVLCRALAFFGGAVLVGIALMSVTSIVGRATIGKPIPGDFELVQLAAAVCVSAFLPYCQMRGGNIIIDFFTSRASVATQQRLDAFGALLLAIVAAVVAWRTAVGTISAKQNGETSMIMGVPIWYSYALMVPGLALTALAGLHTAIVAWFRSRE